MEPLDGSTGVIGVAGLPQQNGAVSWPDAERFPGLTNDELRRIDPVVLNLSVAKGIPSLSKLDIARYVRLADQWAAEIRGYLPANEANFYKNPERWNNDLDFARLALMGWYVGQVLKIGYREDQIGLKQVLYTDPSDLFLNGIMDTRQGTCANMALLWVVLAQRLGWPVSLATVRAHFIARFDDGKKIINIEAASDYGAGTWSSPPDRYYLKEWGESSIPQRAVDCGSDLRALTPREMLGVFFGARARHLENVIRPTKRNRIILSPVISFRAIGSCTSVKAVLAFTTAWDCSIKARRDTLSNWPPGCGRSYKERPG